MAGAIDMSDFDWASIGDSEGGNSSGLSAAAAAAAVGDLSTVSLVSRGHSHTPAPAPTPPNITAGSRSRSAARNGGAATNTASAAAAGIRASGVARVSPSPPPPLFTAPAPASASAAITTRGSRNQRTSPFNLKACSSCKKGRASAIKCRVDSRHWEDPDWTDPPSRLWVMPAGFVAWLAKEDKGPNGEKPGSPTNAATAAAAAVAMAAAGASAASKSGAGPRAPRVESASSLLDRMLGEAALPPPPPVPVAPPPIPALRVAPGAPAAGGGGIKRPRCLARGCSTAVAKDAAFCSDGCIVAAQSQAAQALLAYHQGGGRKKETSAAITASFAANGTTGVAGGGDGLAAGPSTTNAGGGDAAAAGGGGGDEGGGSGGGKSVVSTTKMSPFSSSATPLRWTEHDEEEFSSSLKAVRDRSAQTPALRFRHKIMDRFRELFAEGMAELGMLSADVMLFSGVLAWDLEHELHVFSRTDRAVYKEKAQSVRFNIKFAKNPELFKVCFVPVCGRVGERVQRKVERWEGGKKEQDWIAGGGHYFCLHFA